MEHMGRENSQCVCIYIFTFTFMHSAYTCIVSMYIYIYIYIIIIHNTHIYVKKTFILNAIDCDVYIHI